MPDDIAPDPDALPAEALRYPELDTDDGVAADGTLDADVELDAESAAAWLRDLADAVESHDLGVAGDDYRGVYGIGPRGATVSFDPDADHRGELTVSFRFAAKTMTVEAADAPQVGARGGRGFIPLAMLDDDRDADEFRCYNWVDEPTPVPPGGSEEDGSESDP
ncbi:hypothetical protein [Halobaculum marinum]|uniref:Uncharacterized protein n=1 Tax=Halobaculum marinum TaxID=3031996 RepID=A0ABD5WTJ4_9EURY|nr:hypothetical protein [Halobaculum sp. DT55]